MRVAIKLALALLLCACGVLGASAWLSVKRELSLIEEDMRQDMRGWGRLTVELIRQVRLDEGDAAARALVQRLPQPTGARVRWIDLDASEASAELTDAQRAQVRAGETLALLAHGEGGFEEIVTYVALDPPGSSGSAALELCESLAPERAWIQGSVVGAVGSTLVMGTLFGLLAVVIGLRVVGRPVQELIVLARRVGAGDLGLRLALGQRDEIGQLAREMNAMCDHLEEARRALEAASAARAETLNRLRHAERLATVGQLAAGVAHQLGTPLSVIQGRADLIVAGVLDAEEISESGRVIGNLSRRMAGVVRQTLDYARPRPAHRSRHDLRRLARRMLELLADVATREEVAIDLTSSEEPLYADVDGNQVEQVIANLLVNAVQASPPAGRIAVSVEPARLSRPGGDPGEPPLEVAVIEVRDQGCGITPDDLSQLWQPFFTTKAVGEGTGLGLPIAKGIVEEHGGWLEVTSQEGQGSEFRAVLPRQVAAAEGAQSE